MEMTEDEIVSKYLKSPDTAMINIIADLNGTQPHYIKTILEKRGVLKKRKNTKSDDKKSDKTEKTDIKTDSIPVDTRSEEVKVYPVELIPEAVKGLTEAKIRENRAKIEYHCEEINKLNDENNELLAFLKGESYGDKDRIHWEVQDQQV
jgi:hypothetical protein